MNEEKKKKRQLTVQMDSELYETFSKVAKVNDRSMGMLVRDFVKDYIKKNAQGDLFSK